MRVTTPHELALAARQRRLDLGWSQGDLARRIGSSRKWVSDFEAGKSTVELALVLNALDVLELRLDVRVAQRPALDLDSLLTNLQQEHADPDG